MSNQNTRVIVAMSGGVDSSVAAALLVEQGFDVIGMMLRLWSEPGRETYNRCCTPAAMETARRVAGILDIPFYAVDAKDTFHEIVVNYFAEGYLNGNTPNPCLMCNRHIRWEYLLNRGLSMGAQFMATGHYARVIHNEDSPVRLLRAVDQAKDQSYVISILNQSQLRHALFPLGEYTKTEVRALAEKFNLPSAHAKESQDLCFLAGTDYPSFLRRNYPDSQKLGPIINNNGETIGQHQGLAFYTIGQRKGLGLSSSVPLYVKSKDPSTNTLLVTEKAELGDRSLQAGSVNWVNGVPREEPFEAEVKIRYGSKYYKAQVIPDGNARLQVIFNSPVPDITPGQAAVIYAGQEVIANGIIEHIKAKDTELIAIRIMEHTE